MSALRTGFAQLRLPWRGVVAAVAPITAIVGMLLALGLIHPFGGDALAQSATRTGDAGTSHVDLTFKSGDRVFSAQGDFDYRAHRGSMNYDFSGTPGMQSLDDIGVVFWGDHAYMRFGDKWVRFDPATAQKLLADSAAAQGRPAPPDDVKALGDLQLNDPSQVLTYLTKTHGAKKIGEATEFGVHTTIYRAPIDTDSGRLVVTASVGDDGYIHRLQVAGPNFTLDQRLSRFGNPVAVQRPPERKVSELSDLLAQGAAGR
jgi:hypothetical protein